MPIERMGSDQDLDVPQTAEVMGIDKRMVYYLVRQGQLRPRYKKIVQGKAPVMTFDAGEISELARVREQKKHDPNKASTVAAQALAIVRQLERRVESLEKVLGRDHWPLRVEEEDVVSLYVKAVDAQQQESFTFEEVLDWARTFMAIGDEYLDALEAFTDDAECWKPFTDLAQIMLTETPSDLQHDIALKTAYSCLEAGNQNLRRAAFFYIKNRFGARAAYKSFNVADEGHTEILSILAATYP